jgi:drug/metabolite transporter (DMT)-like permease
MTVLTLYILAYMARLYLMNYFKNTRPPGPSLDNRGFFAIEQISASGTMLAVGILVVLAPVVLGVTAAPVVEFSRAARAPDPWALLSGVPYAFVAFFSVFIFMYQGRTATFAGLVNRLTSLLAGTTSTLLLAWWFHLKPPGIADWVSFAFIFVAVAFLSRAEQRRVAELRASAPAAAVPEVATAARA